MDIVIAECRPGPDFPRFPTQCPSCDPLGPPGPSGTGPAGGGSNPSKYSVTPGPGRGQAVPEFLHRGVRLVTVAAAGAGPPWKSRVTQAHWPAARRRRHSADHGDR